MGQAEKGRPLTGDKDGVAGGGRGAGETAAPELAGAELGGLADGAAEVAGSLEAGAVGDLVDG